LQPFGNVRWGKLAGLRRRNLDLNNSASVGYPGQPVSSNVTTKSR